MSLYVAACEQYMTCVSPVPMNLMPPVSECTDSECTDAECAEAECTDSECVDSEGIDPECSACMSIYMAACEQDRPCLLHAPVSDICKVFVIAFHMLVKFHMMGSDLGDVLAGRFFECLGRPSHGA